MPKVQMQGRGPGGEVVTWLADAADRTGAGAPVEVTDVALYTRSQAFVGGPPVEPISVTLLEPSTATLTVGVPVRISGRTTRPASSVAVSWAGASGSATVDGLTWSIYLTPTLSGVRTVTATATDAANGTVAIASSDKTIGAAVTFPASVTPAVWFDGRQQAYADSGGTTPASSGRVRRFNEPSPLAGSWTSPTDPERPIREPDTTALYLEDTAGGFTLTRPAVGGILRNACTLFFSFVARDNAFAGPIMGLLRDGSATVGIRVASNEIWVYNGGGNWTTGCLVKTGKRNTIIVRYNPTSIDIMVDADGEVTTASLTGLSLPSTAIAGEWRLALDGDANLYGLVPQAGVFASSIGDTPRNDMRAWLAAQAHPSAFPLDEDDVVWIGDSITRSAEARYSNCFASKSLAAARAAGYRVQSGNFAVAGTGVTRLLAPTTDNESLFLRASALYDARRRKNVMVFALGTNDLANNNDVNYILYGTGAAAGSGIFPAVDTAVAQGWDVIVIVPGPRSDAMFVSQSVYNSRRAAVCDALVAGASTHGYTVIDTRGVSNYGADGDSDNTTYYSVGKVHPIDAGHALIAPVVSATLIARLAA